MKKVMVFARHDCRAFSNTNWSRYMRRVTRFIMKKNRGLCR